MVVEIDGATCTCGRRGCVEAYAGRAAMEAYAHHLHEQKGRKTDLFKLMARHERDRLTSSIWARALEHDDQLALQIIDRAVGALGAGIASAVNLLDVEGVIIGGGLGVRLGHPYAKRIADAMQPHLFADRRPSARPRRRAGRSRRRDRRGPAGPRRVVTFTLLCQPRCSTCRASYAARCSIAAASGSAGSRT